jgi:hypothetical protein
VKKPATKKTSTSKAKKAAPAAKKSPAAKATVKKSPTAKPKAKTSVSRSTKSSGLLAKAKGAVTDIFAGAAAGR